MGLGVGDSTSEVESCLGKSIDPDWGGLGVRRYMGGLIEVSARRGKIVALKLHIDPTHQAKSSLPTTEEELRQWLALLGIVVFTTFEDRQDRSLILQSTVGVNFEVDSDMWVSVSTTTPPSV